MTRLIYSRHWRRFARGLTVSIVVFQGIGILAVARQLEWIADPFVRYACAFVAVQFGILAALVLFLIAGKYVRLRWEWLRALRIRKLQHFISEPGGRDAALRAARKWPDEFLTVVEDAILALKGSARERVVGLLEASAPYPRLVRQTTDRDPGRAIRAISLLGHLENPQARAAVRLAINHRIDAVRQAARKAILEGNDPAAQRAVLDEAAQLPAWPRLVMFHYAPQDSALLPAFIAEALHSQNEERIIVALELVLTQERLLLAPTPARLAQAANPEIRIKFFKALPFLTVEGDLVPVLQTGLRDSDWRVRAMAARACAHFRPAVLADRLLEICRSSASPAESAHAARALASMGGEGWLRLQELAHSESGRARYIATEAVEKRLLGGVA
jgi:HEAT repeat protein